MNRGPYPIADHGLDTRDDARRAEDAWDDDADERWYVRQEAAEDAWLERLDQQRHHPAPDPWRANSQENP